MKLFKSSLIALALSCATSIVNAESLAITNATVHTVTEQGVLTNATVIIEDGKITAINPANISADQVIDAEGKILTPGFIATMNQLGLVEVGAVSRSRDAGDKKAGITFDASLAFNPKSTVIPFARKGGITSNVVLPHGGDDIFKGQIFSVNLSGQFDSVIKTNHGVFVDLGSKSKGSRAHDLQILFNKLEDASKKIAKAKKKDSKKDSKKGSAAEPKRDEIIINDLLAGKKPLLAYVDRATDILALVKIKKQYNLELVLLGAADAVLVAKTLADENIAVIMDPMRNLPNSFDSLHNALTNVATLTKAGVNVVISNGGDTHNLYQLRYDAGNAVANGLSKSAALAAVTAIPADIFNLNAGKIAVGKNADLVLWSADPFELSTKVEQMWIGGKEYSTQSRQDALRNRYTTDSKMPRAYTK